MHHGSVTTLQSSIVNLRSYQDTGAYTAADPNEHFFFLIDALKKKMYNDQVIIPLMNEFLRRGTYREFLQVAAMRIEQERQQNEEKRRQEIEARNSDLSDKIKEFGHEIGRFTRQL